MKNVIFGILALVSAIPACFGQTGADISQAIPVYFGQTINDTLDSTTRPRQVYSITLAKGQEMSATVTGPAGKRLYLYLYGSATHTVINAGNGIVYDTRVGSATFTYQVATSDIYYIMVFTDTTAVPYTFQVTAQGTPIVVPNPAQSGCVTGQVDYITYSLQLVAEGLPDDASIGGTHLCNSCTLKPPAYPQLVEKMEKAMGLNLGVSACYDGTGNIFQLKLIHP